MDFVRRIVEHPRTAHVAIEATAWLFGGWFAFYLVRLNAMLLGIDLGFGDEVR